MVSDQPGWQDQARRLVNLLHDGLRYGAPPKPDPARPRCLWPSVPGLAVGSV